MWYYPLMNRRGICVYCLRERALCGAGHYCSNCYRGKKPRERCERCGRLRSLTGTFCRSCYNSVRHYWVSNRGTGLTAAVYRECIDKIGYQCHVCGYTGPKTLHLHHKDQNPTNNEISNLVFVCPKHHAELHSILRRIARNQRLKAT